MDRQDHGSLALWAADCAGHVLPHFEEERPEDAQPRRAIEAGRAWARGGMKMSEVRAAAFAAHAAREADRAEAQAAAQAAARAPGHAAATAHVATHAPHAAYAAKAAQAADATDPSAAAEERDWQRQRLPEHLRPVAFIF